MQILQEQMSLRNYMIIIPNVININRRDPLKNKQSHTTFIWFISQINFKIKICSESKNDQQYILTRKKFSTRFSRDCGPEMKAEIQFMQFT